MRYEILNDAGEVINTIVANKVFVDANYPNNREVPEPEHAPHFGTVITPNAFFARFGATLVALYTLAMTNVQMQIYRDKVKLALSGIDLASPVTIADVGQLLANGLITQELHDSILNDPVTEAEQFKG